MTPVEIVAAIGTDEHDLRVLQVAGEEHEEIEGRPVGPVQVLDDEQQRDLGAEPFDDTEEMLEQTRPPAVSGATSPAVRNSGRRWASSAGAGPTTASKSAGAIVRTA